MTYTVAQIRGWNPSCMAAEAQQASGAVDGLNSDVDLLQHGRVALFSEYRSRSSAPAGDAHYAKKISAGHTTFEAVTAMVSGIARDGQVLVEARQKVLEAVKNAEAAGFNVDEATNHVTPKASSEPKASSGGGPMPGLAAATQRMERELAAAAQEKLIDDLCGRFEGLDAQIAAQLSDAPNVETAHAQAIIKAVDSGAPIPNYLAALELPYNVYTKAGRDRLARWARRNPYSIQRWVQNGKEINLPPTPSDGKGYIFEFKPPLDTPDMELTYTLAVPAGAGVAALLINRKGVHPTLSGTVHDSNGESATGTMDEKGFNAEVSTDEPGSTNLGFAIDHKGIWADAKMSKPVGPDQQGTVTADLRWRNTGGGDDNNGSQPAHVVQPHHNWFERWAHAREEGLKGFWKDITGPAPGWWPTSNPSIGTGGGVAGVIRSIIQGLGDIA